MSRSLSWIEPGEVDSLLDRAGVSSSLPSKNFARKPIKPIDPREMPPTAPDFPLPPMISETPTVAAAASVDAPAFDEPSVSERIITLERWLRDLVGASYYVADPQGLPMITAGPIKGLVVSSVALERAIRSLRGLTGRPSVASVTIELDASQVLETIWTDTTIGRITVGIFGAEPLPRPHVTAIRDAIHRVFAWETNHGQ